MFDKNNKNALLDEHLTDIVKIDRYIWGRAVVFLLIGGLIGGISVLFRPYFDNGVHVEALVALIMIIAMNLGLLIYFIREKREQYKLAYALSTGAIWGGYTLGWSIVAGYLWEDVYMMSGMFALVSIVVGYLVLFIQKKWFFN